VAEGKRTLVYGLHAVGAVIDRAPERLLELWMAEPRQDARAKSLRERAQAAGVRVQTAGTDSLTKLAGEVAHQGAVAAIRPLKPWDEHELADAINKTTEPLLLILDGVTDPHNLGACLRTADAAGALAVVIPKDRSAAVEGAARKAAAGAAEFGEAGQSIYAADLKRPLALVLGAEGDGMRRLTRESCDFLVRIPMAGLVESLNVSVAAGVALFEARRQRLGSAG